MKPLIVCYSHSGNNERLAFRLKNCLTKGVFIKIRKYESEDCPILASFFYDTVHITNSKDYSQAQLDVWETGNIDIFLG